MLGFSPNLALASTTPARHAFGLDTSYLGLVNSRSKIELLNIICIYCTLCRWQGMISKLCTSK